MQKARAEWKGSLKEGAGTFTLPKANVTQPFTFATRFENADGTNPEELVGAALAACFSMFLSAILTKDEYTVNSINTEASVTLESTDNGPTITAIQLNTEANIDGISDEDFQSYVEKAKTNCPVSKCYTGTSITVEAKQLASA